MKGKVYRQNFDKRTSRIMNGKVFNKCIQCLRQSPPSYVRKREVKPPKHNERGMNKFSVYVRKRPLFDHERRKGEFDVITTTPSSITIHNCRMRADLKIQHAFVESNRFTGFESIFSEKTKNPEVYETAVMPLVQFVLSGKKGVLFMFGQTGSGKTHTITGFQECIARDLFIWKEYLPHMEIRASAFELSGDDIFDLLNRRNKLILRADQNGSVQVCELTAHPCGGPSDIESYLNQALKSRKTVSTKVNSVSSRSHCVFRIDVYDNSKRRLFGNLTLVDLAGSERSEDSMFHDSERISESCKINTSLMALKDCIRAYHKSENSNNNNQYIPYRVDKLCMLLKECFTSKSVRTVVVTTVSPSPTDTEHSLHTLKNTVVMNRKANNELFSDDVTKLLGDDLGLNRKKIAHPKTWTSEQTKNWIGSIYGGKYKKYLAEFPRQLDGKQILRWPIKRFVQCCGGNETAGVNIRKALLKAIKKYDNFKTNIAKENRALHGKGGKF